MTIAQVSCTRALAENTTGLLERTAMTSWLSMVGTESQSGSSETTTPLGRQTSAEPLLERTILCTGVWALTSPRRSVRTHFVRPASSSGEQ